MMQWPPWLPHGSRCSRRPAARRNDSLERRVRGKGRCEKRRFSFQPLLLERVGEPAGTWEEKGKKGKVTPNWTVLSNVIPPHYRVQCAQPSQCRPGQPDKQARRDRQPIRAAIVKAEVPDQGGPASPRGVLGDDGKGARTPSFRPTTGTLRLLPVSLSHRPRCNAPRGRVQPYLQQTKSDFTDKKKGQPERTTTSTIATRAEQE